MDSTISASLPMRRKLDLRLRSRIADGIADDIGQRLIE